MMMPASRNAVADWSFSEGPRCQAFSSMLLLKPPKSQIIAGRFSPSGGRALMYAAKSPAGVRYFTECNSCAGGSGGASPSARFRLTLVANPRLESRRDILVRVVDSFSPALQSGPVKRTDQIIRSMHVNTGRRPCEQSRNDWRLKCLSVLRVFTVVMRNNSTQGFLLRVIDACFSPRVVMQKPLGGLHRLLLGRKDVIR